MCVSVGTLHHLSTTSWSTLCTQGSHAAVRNLNSKVVSLDHDSLKQQEIIYNQVGHVYFTHHTGVYVLLTTMLILFTLFQLHICVMHVKSILFVLSVDPVEWNFLRKYGNTLHMIDTIKAA